ncbi:VOC family protein [Desulfonatronospira sp.]|uniref:VOC family protein n=1 Tax=Desulfonatronospira sp. TaxID=1962951 RepID=UPI0025BF9DA7|nr:VOC family protein [Desulfonatronospira sp.]
MRYKGINHIALATGDLNATIRFWRDLVGLRLIAGLGKPGYRQYFFEIGPRDMLLFFEWSDVRPLPEKDHGVPVKGSFGFDHLALEVETLEDIWQIYDRFKAADIWVSEVLDHGFIYSLYSFDPNNIAIEFSWANPEFDLRNTPRMQDSKPAFEAHNGSDPVSGVWPAVQEPTLKQERKIYPGEGSELRNKENKW